MRDADIARGLELCRAAHWNQVETDWDYFLKNATCLVAEANGRVLGTCAVLDRNGPRAWIAMMLVDPAARRQSIGTLLFERTLAMTNAPSIGLDATAQGRPLYEKYAFQAVAQIDRWLREPAPCDPPPNPIASRWRKGHVSNQIGPIVAKSVDDAITRVQTTLAIDGHRSWIIDVPAEAPLAWHRWLQSAGFTAQRTLSRMYRGQPQSIGSDLYATSGPEYGPVNQ